MRYCKNCDTLTPFIFCSFECAKDYRKEHPAFSPIDLVSDRQTDLDDAAAQ